MINGEAGLAVAAPVVNEAEVPVTPLNASGVVEEQPAVAEDVVALIDGIVLDPVKAKSHVTAGGVSLERLRAIAVMLQLPKSLGKGPLIDSIVAKRKRMRELAALQMAEEREAGTSFRKNKDTIPRILNFLMQHPQALRESQTNASRSQLQTGDAPINSRPVFVQVADDFNDWEKHSGGLIVDQEQYLDADIDPERRNTSGPITAEKVVTFFKEVQKLYRAPIENWEASGQHDPDAFPNFGHNDTNVLWLFDWLQQLNNPFCLHFAWRHRS